MTIRRIILPMLVALVGAALGMWAMATPAHGIVAVLEPLQITKIAADGEHFLPGDNAYYQISINNPNGVTVFLDTITDTLPSGFTYNGESTGGLTSSDPAVSGQTLTWDLFGEVSVGALQAVILTFSAGISTDEPVGMYCNQATVEGEAGLSATGPTAPIQVLNEGDDQLTPTCPNPGLVRSATPTASATVPATVTPVPETETPVPAATATQPGGGSAGVISAPDTGTGSSAGAGTPSTMLLAVAALMVLGGLGAAAAGAIRR